MRNEFKHLENIVRKAKAGVLVSEVKVRSSSQKSADIRIKDIAGRASLTVPSATFLMCQQLHVDNPARETVNTEIEEEVTVIKAVSKFVLEKDNKDSNIEAEEDIGELNKASSKYEEKIEVKMCDTNKNIEKETEKEFEMNRKHFKCDFCEYKCKNNKILPKHLDSNHSKCFICETRFSTAETLKTHKDMHADVEMFDSLNRLCDSVTNQ